MEPTRPTSNFQVLFFIIILCFAAGLILAIVSFSLKNPQKEAKEFDESKQMLIAAKILSSEGYFELLQEDGTLQPASFDTQKKILTPDSRKPPPLATEEDIKTVAKLRIRPLLTDAKGNLSTFSQKGIDLSTYREENKESGFGTAPDKLVYVILPNSSDDEKISEEDLIKDLTGAYAFVIPVSGFGLWAPIYGFIALFPGGDKVIGTTWYEQAETPGLGANISEPAWQKQFYGKLIFQPPTEGATDFQTAPMGIIVVKGRVKDIYGNSPRSKNAVDGMSGATLTGDGVTAAYRNSLTPYREFLIKMHNLSKK